MLLKLVQEYGDNWREIAQHIPGRLAAQCRERYTNYIGPNVIKGWWWPAAVRHRHWTQEEDDLILQLQKQWGNRWSAIKEVGEMRRCDVQELNRRQSSDMAGRCKRSDTDVRNRFKTLKVLMIMKVDVVE